MSSSVPGRLLALLVAVLCLTACYEVETPVVERNDEEAAAQLAGVYYSFDDLPGAVSDWSGYRDRWKSRFEVAQDPYIGLYFLLARSRSGAPGESYVARARKLDGNAVIAQAFSGTAKSFVFVLRREADGVLRTMRVDEADRPGLQQRHGLENYVGSLAPSVDQGAAANRTRIVAYLADAARLGSTTWPILLVPASLVDR